MDSHPPRKTGHLFELFLYAAIILETGLAAFFYKLALQDRGLGSLKIYFALGYFAFLGWAIGQLNKLHRKRKVFQTEVVETAPEPEREPEPAAEFEPAPARRGERARPLLGLTIAQLAIVAIVFGTAVATFSWAFKILESGR
jgi:hypothetical protein